jgi:hypothetical protein
MKIVSKWVEVFVTFPREKWRSIWKFLFCILLFLEH